MNQSKKRAILHGAGALAIAGVVVKVTGALYKIPLGVMLGPVGMANFSIAYNIYSLLFVIATAGVPVAVSKLVAESLATGRGSVAQKIFSVSRKVFFLLGFSGFIAMFFGAEFLSRLMGSSDSAPAIRAISPAVMFVSLSAVSRGYFQGYSDMYPTAVSEVAEAFGKLFVGLTVAWVLKKNGASPPIIAAGALFGVSVGALLSVIYFKFRIKRLPRTKKVRGGGGLVIKRLFSLSVPITVGAAVISLTAVIDSALVMNILKSSGFSEYMSKWLFGGYTYASTLFSLPSFFTATIASALVPAIASEKARGSEIEVDRLTNSSLRLAILISSLSAFGMAALSDAIMVLLYGSGADADCLLLASQLLKLLCLGVIPLSVVTVTNAVHQAMGNAKIPVISILCGGALKLFSNYILVSIPGININGAAISTVICYIVAAGINVINLKKYPCIGIDAVEDMVKPILVGVMVFFSATIINFKTKLALGVHFSTLFSVLIGAIVGISGTFLLKIVRKEDGKLIFGNANIFKFIDID